MPSTDAQPMPLMISMGYTRPLPTDADLNTTDADLKWRFHIGNNVGNLRRPATRLAVRYNFDRASFEQPLHCLLKIVYPISVSTRPPGEQPWCVRSGMLLVRQGLPFLCHLIEEVQEYDLGRWSVTGSQLLLGAHHTVMRP
jgi:hypothetical protein